jgi:hypothetical protein
MNEVHGPNEEQVQKDRRSIILVATILLALVAVSTAWCAYMATDWGGRAQQNYALANAAHTESLKAFLTANQLSLLDVQIFTQWLNAWEAGKTELADFYRTRMRAEARPAFDAWVAQEPRNNPDAPSSPFVMPEYVVQERVKADQLLTQAKELAQTSTNAADVANQYVITTLVWALTLFFAGMSSNIPVLKISRLFALMAMVLFAFGVVRLVMLSVTN